MGQVLFITVASRTYLWDWEHFHIHWSEYIMKSHTFSSSHAEPKIAIHIQTDISVACINVHTQAHLPSSLIVFSLLG